MFSVKSLSRLLSVVIALAMVVGLAPAAHSLHAWDYLTNDDEYHPVDTDGVRLGFGDRQYRWDPGITLQRQYLTGDSLNDVYALVRDVGMTAPLDNAKLTITFPKSEHAAADPIFPDNDQAQRVERREDDTAFYADYYFDRIDIGADIRVPLDFSFRNGVTLPGTTYTPTVELFVDGQSFATNEVTFWAHVTTRFDTDSDITDGVNYFIPAYEVGLPAHKFSVEDLETQGWRTPAEGITITYRVGARVLQSWDRDRGIVETDAYKFVVKLQEFMEVHPDSLAAGWVHDPVANTLTYSADTSTSECDPDVAQCKELKLVFRHAPVATDNTWNGPTREYTPWADMSYFYQGKEVRKFTTPIRTIRFVPDEIPRFKGRTHEVTINKYELSPERPEGATYSSYNIVAEDDVWNGNLNLGPGGAAPQGLGWEATIGQTNNGSTLDPIAVGGLKDNLQRIIEKDLDPRMYFYQLWLDTPSWSPVEGNASLIADEVIARINDTSNVVWGVTADGSKIEIARNIDLDQKVVVDDKARRFERLEVEFTTPLVMDNFRFLLKTTAFPLPEERARWERQEYQWTQVYPSTTVIEYVTDEETDTNTKEATGNQLITPPTRELSFSNLNPTQQVSYSRCQSDQIPGMDPTSDPNCYRFATTGIDTTASTFGNTWGPYSRPLGDYKHLYLLPQGLSYAGLEWARSGNFERNAQPAVEIVEDFHGTGHTAVILNFGDVDHQFGSYGGAAGSMIKLFVEADPTNTSRVVKKYVLWDNNDVIKASTGRLTDTEDLDEDSITDESFLGGEAVITYRGRGDFQVTKKASVDGGPFTSGTVFQEIGGEVKYQISATNTGRSEIDYYRLTDIFPSPFDASIGEDRQLKPRQWMLDGEVKTHSGFHVQLTGPVASIRSFKDGVDTDASSRVEVTYGLTTPYPNDPLGIGYRWRQVYEYQVTDWNQVSAVYVDFRPGQGVEPGETVTFTTNHVVKSDQAVLPPGTKAVNTVNYNDFYDTFESLPSVVEIASYRVGGVAFEDLDANGLKSANDPVIANVPFTVVDATTGAPVQDALGAPITGMTDDQGGYSVQIPQRGEYRIRFEKESGQTFATTGQGSRASHVAVCAGSADNFTGTGGVMGAIVRATGIGNAGATDENCASGSATVNNFGWTSAFVLNPTNVVETRNVGLTEPQGVLTVVKKDQNGAPVPGAEFTLTPKGGTGTQVSGVTGDNGELRLGPVPFGDYSLAETKAPAGYRGLDAPMDVTMGPDTAPVEVINHRIEGQIVVSKLDADDRKPIAGAQFELRGDHGVVIGAATSTNEQGIATFGGVGPGTYQLVETQPAAGYQVPTQPAREVIVPAEGGTINVEITNTAIRGSITATKVAAGTGTPLAGARFELRNLQGEVIDTQTSGEDGQVTFAGVLAGRYQVAETQAPAGYHLSAGVLDAEILTADQVVNLGAIENQPHRGQIEFTKVSGAGGAPLAGATFELREGTRVVATATSTDQGLVRFDNLAHGSYQIIETQAPVGHIVNPTPMDVEVTSDDLVNLPEVSNQPITGEVTLLKTDGPTREPLAGAVFSLQTPDGVELDSQTTGQDGRLRFENVRPGHYHVVETVAPEGYQLLQYPLIFEMDDTGGSVDLGEVGNTKATGTVQLTKVDAVTGAPIEDAEFELRRGDQVVNRVWSDENGLVTFLWVDYGDYTVVEAAPAPGYRMDDVRFDVQIRQQDEVVDLGQVTNSPEVGSLEFTKIDAVTGAPIQGAVFGLFQDDQLRFLTESTSEGLVRFENVPFGAYALRETQAPEGYVLDAQERDVTIASVDPTVLGNVPNVPYVSTVHLRKVDAATGQPLAGARFVLFNDRAEEVDQVISGQEGQVAFAQVRAGFYTLVEMEAPAGYQRLPEPIEVTVAPDGQPVNLGDLANHPISGEVVLTKVDSVTGDLLPGTHFELRQGQTTVAQAVTGQDGALRIPAVPYGSFTLVETQPAPGYVATTQQWPVTISEQGQVVDLGRVENEPAIGSIEFTKVDATSHKPLAGAVFALKQGDQEIALATSNEEGLVRFDTARAGTYQVVEVSAPTGYQVRTNPLEVTVSGQGETVRLDAVENHPIVGGIRLTKVDAVNPAITLPGVRFALVDGEGNTLQEKVTGPDGSLTFDNVPYGTYHVVETHAQEGYQLADDRMQVTVTEHGKVIDMGPVGNHRIVGDLTLTKVEAGTARALAGVGFELRTPGGAVVAQGVTDEQGALTFASISYGVYELVETAALPGFQRLSANIPVTIEEHGKTVHVGEVANERIRGDIALKAVDKETRRPLAGATFELVGENGAVHQVTSNGEGNLLFTAQLWGSYTLVETGEPAGYLPTQARIPVTINTHGELVNAGVVEYSREPGTRANPPGPGDLWKVFIPLIGLVGLGSHGSSTPDPGPEYNHPVPPQDQPVVAPAPPEEQPQSEAKAQPEGKALAATGTPALPLVALALVLMLVGGLILRRRS